ncbi:hypothetical protein GCM10022419_099630 [Nonomuraea rosea]|uniref:HTH luxR-type domain-containing protein n=1 Tax=Nonomuraea rosea TaxID=638574 RepID=A0ABP6Z8P1_9ACTN
MLGCSLGVATAYAGASGLLVKDMAWTTSSPLSWSWPGRDALIAPGVTRRLIEAFADRPGPDSAPREPEGVTEREREVLTLIARGLTNAEIAADLVISVATVQAYVGQRLSDRAQVVLLAYEAGLVSPSK